MAMKPGPRTDLTKQKFHSWEVLRLGDHLPRGGWMWWCRCLACGVTERQVNAGNLKAGVTKDCGCGRRASVAALHHKHGETGTPTYIAWRNMIGRCCDPSNKSYKDYGAKGVRVAEAWLGENGYTQFVADVGHRPDAHATIDRIDPAGNYEPGNVRWLPRTEQNRNKRNSIRVTHNGVTKTLTEWAKEYGVTPGGLHFRYAVKGMSFEDCLSKPSGAVRRKFEYQGRLYGVGELSRLTGVDRKVLYLRLVRGGWPVERAVSEPVAPQTGATLTYNGVTKTVVEWAKEIGLCRTVLQQRMAAGWTDEEVLTRPPTRRAKNFRPPSVSPPAVPS